MADNESIQNSCRVCATHTVDGNSIFDVIHKEKRSIDMLEYCFQQPIDTTESFPRYVCTKCTWNLIETYEFFILYKQSEAYFHQQIPGFNIKLEIPTAIEEDTADEFVNIKFEPEIELRESAVEFKWKNERSIERMTVDQFNFSQSKHVSEMNNPIKSFECDVCFKTYAKLPHLKTHQSKFKSINSKQCIHNFQIPQEFTQTIRFIFVTSVRRVFDSKPK